MSLGTYLLGTAILILLVTYIGRPLRRQTNADDTLIEKWLSSLKQSEHGLVIDQVGKDSIRLDGRHINNVETANVCPYCGRRVEEDHRYCPSCGKPLAEGNG